ncbi:hypothetical protein [Roseovarius aestuariivivens]|uniref:hypothetical protein n=1 Tax=Roseovarius aestuariivivens TaxID=1888910 RepID=UPI00107FD5B4|nr:hypothetical protein [Roseovarius aestuariivivens]
MQYAATAHKLADQAAIARLREKLLRVTTSCDALHEEKSTLSQDYAALIAHLSQEIDETILPRKFALFSDAGIEATFVVSNRRLIELKIGKRTVEFDTEMDTDADTVARVCARALRALSLRSGPLRVRPIGRATKVNRNGATCAARHLLEYSRLSQLQNRLKTFLKTTHSKSLGWVYHSADGQIVSHDPDKTIRDHLHKLLQKVMSENVGCRRLGRLGRAGPTCSAFEMATDIQVLIADDGNDRLLAAIPTSHLSKALAQWNQVFKRSKA